MAAKKKGSVQKQISSAEKKVKGKGALMSKKEQEDLLGMVPSKKAAKKKAVKKK